MHRRASPIRTLIALALAGCASDASVDLSVEAWDGRVLESVDVVVCSARDRSDVLDRVTLGPSSASTVRVPADGSAVAFAATAPGGLCAASCQMELDAGATFEGALVLFPCLACPRADVTADNVCRDPLCFVEEAELSACD